MTVLSGKKIIVTGGSRGIGRAIAEACASSGATVGVNYLHSEASAHELREKFPGQIELLKFDVGDHAAAKPAIINFIARHGKLDALVNNAGIARPHLFASHRDLSGATEELRVNTLGTMNCTHIVLPSMIKSRDGLIVNISSVAVTQPQAGLAVYAASKAAIEGFTRAIAVEYASRRIRCFCLRLGPVETDMLRDAVSEEAFSKEMPDHTLVKRLSTPDEVAQIIHMLLIGPGALATGSVLDFTAGYCLL
jgi:3-oxoacyl-[acyl-carrier protein] reductase